MLTDILLKVGCIMSFLIFRNGRNQVKMYNYTSNKKMVLHRNAYFWLKEENLTLSMHYYLNQKERRQKWQLNKVKQKEKPNSRQGC